MYKLVPVGFGGNLDDLEFEFFNENGKVDSGNLVPQNDIETFTDYEFSIRMKKNLMPSKLKSL